MSEKDGQTIKVKIVSHEEIEERMKQYLLHMKGEGDLEEPIHEPLIILPGEYSKFMKKGENTSKSFVYGNWYCSKDRNPQECPILNNGERKACVFVDTIGFPIVDYFIANVFDKCEWLVNDTKFPKREDHQQLLDSLLENQEQKEAS